MDFDTKSIHKYKINISTFDYSVASNVIEKFNLRLPKGFGFFENDTILNGSFHCNNWHIKTPNNLKNWNIQESFKKKNFY